MPRNDYNWSEDEVEEVWEEWMEEIDQNEEEG